MMGVKSDGLFHPTAPTAILGYPSAAPSGLLDL
jgi:hypothetical protein